MVDTEAELLGEIVIKLAGAIGAGDDVVVTAWIDGLVGDTEGTFVDVVGCSASSIQDVSKVVDIVIGFSVTIFLHVSP